MRKYLVVLMSAGVFLCSGINAQQSGNGKPAPVIQWHYAGEKSLEGATNVATLRQLWALPESQAWRKAVFEMLGMQASRHFAKGKTNQEIANLITPLLSDLATVETKFELRGSNTNDVDWALALRLPKERAEQWSSNLRKLVASSPLGEPQGSGSEWSAKSRRDNYIVRLKQTAAWTLITGGYGGTEAEKAVTQGLTDKPADIHNHLLQAKLDLPALKKIAAFKILDHAPAIDLNVVPRGEGLRSEVGLRYPEDLQIKLEKWAVPTNTIRDPLIGFTAIQGVQAHLAKSKLIESLQPTKVPNQLYLWSRSISPFGVYFAADVGDSLKVMENIKTLLLPKLELAVTNLNFGNLEYKTNLHSLAWLGLPILVPFVRPAAETEKQFIFGGFFPTTEEKPNPMPAELAAQLEKKDLVYYDWEITEARTSHWELLWQASRIVRGRGIPDEHSASERWLNAISSKLGNTITDATLAGPRELKVVRQSHVGLSALELVFLAHVIDPDLPVGKGPHTPRVQGEKRTNASPGPRIPPNRRLKTPTPANPAIEPKAK